MTVIIIGVLVDNGSVFISIVSVKCSSGEIIARSFLQVFAE